MKTKLLAILSILVIVGMLPGSAFAAPQPIDYKPVDAGPIIRGWDAAPERIENTLAQAAAETIPAATPYTQCVLDTKIWLRLNAITGGYGLTNYHLVAQGPLAQIWVQTNLAWPDGDPRPTPQVTCEQAQYLLAEFESKIYPKETAFFGMPDGHDGFLASLPGLIGLPADYYYDADGRQVVLVSNVRDENYFDPTYPNYIAGFYSSSYETYFDRNVMTIDAYDWLNRIGATANRPYLYEGVFAHEYQHLLHDDYDSDEENWINEGLADWAMGLVGYGAAIGHLEDLIDMPENSLVAWEDQGGLEVLADYGLAYIYQEYMYENYGGQSFIQTEFHNPLNGIASVDDTLAALHYNKTFADTYHAFAPALYTKGAFTHPDLKTFQINVGHPGMPNPEAFATPGAPPWGADYMLVWGYESIANLKFNGYQFNPLSWTSDGSSLWGGKADLIDNWAIFETTGGGTLTFDTKYDIENLWDFGFVQVSEDGGHTWTSLSNASTTINHDPHAHPTVVANLPGLTGSTDGAWVNMSFDLSAYPPQNILVAFRYITDWGTTEAGWYIDNVRVDGTLISDGSSTAGFKSLNEVLGISNDYTVLLIGERIRAGKPQYEVKTLMSGGYVAPWYSVRKMFDNYRQLLVVVIYDAPQGVSSYADYTFQVDHRGGAHLK